MSQVLQAVRQKYPQYEKLSDDELARAVGERHPQYLEKDPEFAKQFQAANERKAKGDELRGEMAKQERKTTQARATAKIWDLGDKSVRASMNALGTASEWIASSLRETSRPMNQAIQRGGEAIVGAEEQPYVEITTRDIAEKAKFESREDDSTSAKVAKGIANAAIGVVGDVFSPEGVVMAPLGVGGLGRKTLMAALAGQSTLATEGGIQALSEGDVQAGVEQLTMAAAGAGAVYALRPGGMFDTTPQSSKTVANATKSLREVVEAKPEPVAKEVVQGELKVEAEAAKPVENQMVVAQKPSQPAVGADQNARIIQEAQAIDALPIRQKGEARAALIKSAGRESVDFPMPPMDARVKGKIYIKRTYWDAEGLSGQGHWVTEYYSGKGTQLQKQTGTFAEALTNPDYAAATAAAQLAALQAKGDIWGFMEALASVKDADRLSFRLKADDTPKPKETINEAQVQKQGQAEWAVEADPFSREALTKPAATPGLMIVSPAMAAKGARILSGLADTWEKTKAVFRPRGMLPQELHDLRVRMNGIKAKAERSIVHTERDLMRALQKHYGISTLKALGGGGKAIPKAAIETMDAYMQGKNLGRTIPTEIRGILDGMRAEIDHWSRLTIDELTAKRNRMPPSQRASTDALIEKISNNLDVYAHRSYRFFDVDKTAPQWWKELDPDITTKAVDYVEGNTTLTRTQAESKLLDWLSDLKDNQHHPGGKLGAKDESMFMRRNIIVPEIKALLGEYKTPIVNYSKSVYKMASWVAHNRFLENARRVGMGRYFFEEGANPPGFNAKIAADGSSAMHPLDGLRTTQNLADAFKAMGQHGRPHMFIRWFYAAVAQSKFAATGQSIMTHVRNLASRAPIAIAAGHWNFPVHLKKGILATFSDATSTGKRWRSYMDRAIELGVVHDSVRGGEYKALIRDASLNDMDPALIGQFSYLRFAKNVGWKIPGEIYRFSDDLGNIVGWEAEKAQQRRAHPSWPEARIEEYSAKIIRELYPLWGETPAFLQAFRKVPFYGPFASFAYHMIRNSANSVIRGAKELASSNIEERMIGLRRLTGIATAATSVYTLQEMSKAWMGISDQEEQDFRLFRSEFDKNSAFLFYDKNQEAAEISVDNLSFFSPHAFLVDPVISILTSQDGQDKPIADMLLDASKEFFQPWVSESMLISAYTDAKRNKTQFGGRVYEETDDDYVKAAKSVAHLTRTLLPGTIQRMQRRMIPAFRDEQTLYGRKLDPTTEVVRELSGHALEKFDYKVGLRNKALEFGRLDRDSEQHFIRRASQTKKTTDAELVEAYKESDRRRFEHWQNMRAVYMAAIRRGVSREQAALILMDANAGKTDSMAIASGIYIPATVSLATIANAQKVKRTLPIKEINEYRLSVMKRPLDRRPPPE